MDTQVEQNKAANLEQFFYVDGVLTSASGAVTVTITRADGTVLVSGAATTLVSPGVYRYTLAPQANLDRLTVVWSGTWGGSVQTETTYVEVVGDFFVTLAELRALPNLADTAKFTNAELAAARQWFERTFEDHTAVAWVPRYRRATVEAYGNGSLLLPNIMPRRILSVRTYTSGTLYTDFTADDIAGLVLESSGRLTRWGAYFTPSPRVVVAYEHGFDSAPTDVVEAAKVAIRDHLLTDNVGNRQFSVATEAGIVRSSTPGEGRPFGIPFVDEVVGRRSHRVPGVA